MNFNKRVNGSWTDTPNYIHKTDTDTITTLPAVLYPTGATATVGLKGQTTQSSIPSPASPVMPEGTGERTGNLFPLDATKLHVGRIEKDGTIDYEVGTITVGTDSVTYEANTAWRGFYTDFIQVNENKKLTFSPNNKSYMSWACTCYDENDNFLGSASTRFASSTIAFTLLTRTKKVRINVTSSNTTYTVLRPMLNTGSEALPYEPYGIKIPISSANTTTPVYLGEVESTRRIKKLVLTGQETIPNNDGASYNSETSTDRFVRDIPLSVGNNGASEIILCTHLGFQAQSWAARTKTGCCIYCSGNTMQLHLRFDNTTLGITQSDTNEQRTEKLKAYLAQQYAAGTPVTIWYVLATPTTGIVNEPLMRIGEYADTVSGITIPTIAGANTLSIGTTLQPSEVTATYKGWHPVQSVHERENGQWD